MPRKDTLAAGARTATFAGGFGDGENLHKVSDEARDEWKPEAAPAARRKRFIPSGETLFVKRDEAKLGTGIIELAESVEKEQPAQGVILAVSRVHEHDYTEGQYIAFGKYSGTLFQVERGRISLTARRRCSWIHRRRGDYQWKVNQTSCGRLKSTIEVLNLCGSLLQTPNKRMRKRFTSARRLTTCGVPS